MREKYGLKKLQNEIPIGQFRTMSQPILVTRASSVSGKLYLASEMGNIENIGYDCAAAGVNDIIATGAEPVLFYENISCVRPKSDKIRILEAAATKACKEADIQFAGSEITELPDHYAFDQYELSGFAVGIADRRKKIGTAKLEDGDVIIGLPSNGLHNNGYIIARKQLYLTKGSMEIYYDSLGSTLGEQLLLPTRIYRKPIEQLLAMEIEIKSCVQVGHGGLERALQKLLHETYGAVVKRRDKTIPPLYQMLQKDGNISPEQMRKTFNMGIGMLLIVSEEASDQAVDCLEEAGEDPISLGLVETGGEIIRFIS